MKSQLTLLASCLLTTFAHAVTNGDLFDTGALFPEAREEVFLTPEGREEWGFAEAQSGVTLGKDAAILGWGNYEGKQPHAERVHLPTGPMTVSVTMKASAPVTATFLPWCDGMAGGKVPESKTVRADERTWQAQWMANELHPTRKEIQPLDLHHFVAAPDNPLAKADDGKPVWLDPAVFTPQEQ